MYPTEISFVGFYGLNTPAYSRPKSISIRALSTTYDTCKDSWHTIVLEQGSTTYPWPTIIVAFVRACSDVACSIQRQIFVVPP